MILKSTISQTANTQRENLLSRGGLIERVKYGEIQVLASHALIIAGVRRCGKSTLLRQLLENRAPDAFYLNFEDPRLYGFELADFVRLDEVIKDSSTRVIMLDEIQIITKWELYIRQKLDENFQIIITGSNASLLSRELGTKLTGRHITKELFPFSYFEFCKFTKRKHSEKSLLRYLDLGGFPEFLRDRNEEILTNLFDDILMRDIAMRHGIRDTRSLKLLASYLVSNIAKLVTANKLRPILDISATSTVLEYLSYLEAAYLIFLVPKFSYSIKKQIVNPRKIYSIDTGMVATTSNSFSQDQGRRFENLIFLHLRRKNKEVFYFSEKGECDFIVKNGTANYEAFQVCSHLNQDNLDREINGLFEALAFFNLKIGTIITLKQSDSFKKNGMIAKVVPAHEFLTSNP